MSPLCARDGIVRIDVFIGHGPTTHRREGPRPLNLPSHTLRVVTDVLLGGFPCVNGCTHSQILLGLCLSTMFGHGDTLTTAWNPRPLASTSGVTSYGSFHGAQRACRSCSP